MDTAYKLTHQHISFFKSFVRIFGYALIWQYQFVAAAFVLIVSEIIGIVEEIGY